MIKVSCARVHNLARSVEFLVQGQYVNHQEYRLYVYNHKEYGLDENLDRGKIPTLKPLKCSVLSGKGRRTLTHQTLCPLQFHTPAQTRG